MVKILIISPDIISLNMFHTYIMKNVVKNQSVTNITVNGLISKEKNQRLFDEVAIRAEKDDFLIILYRLRKNITKNILEHLPSNYSKMVDFVVYLSLYSVTPEVLKDRLGVSEEYLKTWDSFVKKIEEVA